MGLLLDGLNNMNIWYWGLKSFEAHLMTLVYAKKNTHPGKKAQKAL